MDNKNHTIKTGLIILVIFIVGVQISTQFFSYLGGFMIGTAFSIFRYLNIKKMAEIENPKTMIVQYTLSSILLIAVLIAGIFIRRVDFFGIAIGLLIYPLITSMKFARN